MGGEHMKLRNKMLLLIGTIFLVLGLTLYFVAQNTLMIYQDVTTE